MSTAASGASASDQRRASASSQPASSSARVSAQPQPYGRSQLAPEPAAHSASAASPSGENCRSSAARTSATGTPPGTTRSSRTSSQCISTHECQSRLPKENRVLVPHPRRRILRPVLKVDHDHRELALDVGQRDLGVPGRRPGQHLAPGPALRHPGHRSTLVPGSSRAYSAPSGCAIRSRFAISPSPRSFSSPSWIAYARAGPTART